MNFIHCFQSEWLKKKRSAASWLTIAGAFLIPLILLVERITHFDSLYAENTSPELWENISWKCWQFMAIFLLPMGVIIATSLITQLEFKNNTWKQLHTTPQSFSVIFFAKLAVILTMMLQFFVLFNIGIYLTAVVPSLIFRGIPYPKEAIPFVLLLKVNAKFFIDCLPIIALQYIISLQFKNFLVPIAFGLGLFVMSMIAISWEYAYIIPYIYCTLNFMSKHRHIDPHVHIHLLALAYTTVFIVTGYILYVTKKEKG